MASITKAITAGINIIKNTTYLAVGSWSVAYISVSKLFSHTSEDHTSVEKNVQKDNRLNVPY